MCLHLQDGYGICHKFSVIGKTIVLLQESKLKFSLLWIIKWKVSY